VRAGESLDDAALLNETNLAFHRQIALASGNTVLHQLLEVLSSVFRKEQRLILDIHGSHRDDHGEHVAILEALERRDVALAVARMRRTWSACARCCCGGTNDELGERRPRFTPRPIVPMRIAVRSVAALALAWSAAAAQAQTAIRVRNNHDLPFRGPVRFATTLPDGSYGPAARCAAGSRARWWSWPREATCGSSAAGRCATGRSPPGPLRVTPRRGGVDLRWLDRQLGRSSWSWQCGRAPPRRPRRWHPASARSTWRGRSRRTARCAAACAGTATRWSSRSRPYGGGWVDMTARLTRVDAPTGPAYVALVRR
jgi:hypothetical protein